MGEVNYQLDATGHNDTYLNTSLPFPNPDSVQEFNLQSSDFTAEFGNAAGGIVNIVTKSGTNDIHGTLFHFIRNGKLNARQFFAPTQDALRATNLAVVPAGLSSRTSCSISEPTRARIFTMSRPAFPIVPMAAERGGGFLSCPNSSMIPYRTRCSLTTRFRRADSAPFPNSS